MKKIKKFSALLLLLTVSTLLGFMTAHRAGAAPIIPQLLRGSHRKVCGTQTTATVNCFAQVVNDKSGQPAVTSLPAGYGPTQFHGAYQLPNTSTNPGTIAIVDAYDDPNIISDLANYDKTFSLPIFPSCSKTITTSCFQKVNQNGGTFYPSRSSSWAIETSLDVQTAHEVCQNCKLILVEASSASYTNLMKAEDEARLLGAKVISNSYGSSEFSSEITYDSHFNYPGIAFVFSSGDSGYGSSYPAGSPNVTAVGGTTLDVNSNNSWQSESIWSGANSGCSLFEAKPSFQADPLCAKRTIADVAADADPNTGAAVYDSYGYSGYRGWFQVGGTSLAAPIIAGTYALANNVGPTTFANSFVYSNYNYSSNLHDITTGSNGSCGTYLCQAQAGYDGPSGLGTPVGLAAF